MLSAYEFKKVRLKFVKIDVFCLLMTKIMNNLDKERFKTSYPLMQFEEDLN